MGEGIDHGGADAKAGEGAGTGHKSDFGEVLPSFAVFGEFIADKSKEFFGECVTRLPFVSFVV